MKTLSEKTAITLIYNPAKRIEFSVPYDVTDTSSKPPQDIHILISIRHNLGKNAAFPYSTFNPAELSTILQTLAKQNPQPKVRIIITDTLQRFNENSPDAPESSQKYIDMMDDILKRWFEITVDTKKMPENGIFDVTFVAPNGVKIESAELPHPLSVHWCRWDKTLMELRAEGETVSYKFSEIEQKIHEYLNSFTELPKKSSEFMTWRETLPATSNKKTAIDAMMMTIDMMASRHQKTSDWNWKRNSYKYLREELPYFLWVLLNPNKHFIYPLDSGCSPVVVAFLKLLAKDFHINEKELLTTTTSGQEIAKKWHSSHRGAVLRKAANMVPTPTSTTPHTAPLLTSNLFAIFSPPSRPHSTPPANSDETSIMSSDRRRSSAPARLQTFADVNFQHQLLLSQLAQKKVGNGTIAMVEAITSAHLAYLTAIQKLLLQEEPPTLTDVKPVSVHEESTTSASTGNTLSK